MPTPAPPLPDSFARKKALILAQLSVPAEEYDDASPKGSVDEGVRELIADVNGVEGWVTTSSCAGRVVVFAEGERRRRRTGLVGEREDSSGSEERQGEDSQGVGERGRSIDPKQDNGVKLAGAGGKGGGGRWLFMSHEPVDMDGVKGGNFSSFLGMQRMGRMMDAFRPFAEERLIHFKFEPMILHVLTASLSHAQSILRAALQAGFRESGAINLTSASSEAPMPMVAVRSSGLMLDSVIGRLDIDGEGVCIVSDTHLEGLLAVANDRLEENSRRIARFHELLLGNIQTSSDMEAGKKLKGGDWEDASVRRERKRAEGLKRSQELRGK